MTFEAKVVALWCTKGVRRGSWAMHSGFGAMLVGLHMPPVWALYTEAGAYEVYAGALGSWVVIFVPQLWAYICLGWALYTQTDVCEVYTGALGPCAAIFLPRWWA